MKMRIWLLSLACAATAASLGAAQVAAVLSGDTGPYKEALEGLKSVVGEVDAAILPAMPDVAGAKVIVTFGSEAALKKYPASAVVVAALLPDPKLKPKHGGGVTRIGLPPAPEILAAKVKALQPGAATLAVLDPGNYGEYLSALRSAASAVGLGLQVKKVESVADLATKLPGLKGSVQALWVPPDPLFMNPKTFGLLVAFCKGAGIGLYVPVASLAKAGALAGVAPSFKQQGQAAGNAASTYLAGGNAGEWVYSAKTEFIANKSVAAQLGVGAGALGKADSTVE